jgi:tetratricopeptide (TPR) repeat protein
VADSVTSPRFPPLLLRALLVVGTTLAYANTFSVPFVFDDIAAITQNPSLASFASALFPPDALSVTGRPLANLSLALNHALSRESVWSYHALNLALHLTNTLLLFALIRRTLSGGRSLLAGDCVAFTAASLWSLHPLHTASVTYVMQRTELLAACATLLALYAFTRSGVRWLTVSVVACAAGMTAKETAVVIPLLILAYDRTWGSRSYAAALRARPAFYAALAGTWLILAALLLGTASRGASAGFSTAISATDYALTQVYAVPHYLRLAVWPAPLVFDYGTFLTRSLVHVLPGALVLIALLAATVIALRRRPAVSFCGLCFFALLAPASSVIPIATQTIAEHRVYLALAAPIALLAFILHARFAHRASLFLITLSLGLGVATFARNTTYRSVLSLWQDTAAKAPANPRAHYNLALAQLDAGQRPAALVSLATATRLDPTHALAHHKLGTALVADARFADALPHLTASAQLTPDSAAAHYELANLLVRLARVADAAPHYTTAVRLAPAHAAARYNFGNALTQLGRYADALVQFDEAARLDQADTSARTNAARIRDYLRATPP